MGIVMLRKVFKMVTKLSEGIEHLPYKKQLKTSGFLKIHIFSVMIEAYKIIYGLGKVYKEIFFSVSRNARTSMGNLMGN